MHVPNPAPLRLALFGNAAFSTACAVLMLTAAEPLARATGIPAPLLWSIGIALLIFALDLVLVARLRQVHTALVWAFIGADGAWVVGSVVVLAVASILTPVGQGLVATVALVVGIFAALQYRGLRAAIAAA
jgi:hypothetical protein